MMCSVYPTRAAADLQDEFFQLKYPASSSNHCNQNRGIQVDISSQDDIYLKFLEFNGIPCTSEAFQSFFEELIKA